MKLTAIYDGPKHSDTFIQVQDNLLVRKDRIVAIEVLSDTSIELDVHQRSEHKIDFDSKEQRDLYIEAIV